jgi:HAD superfamily hydrolase (TIGR01450 family)
LSNITDIINKKIFIFDMDGVLYRTNDPIPSAINFVKSLKKLGKMVAYLTNNSTKTKVEFAKKLTNMGLETSSEEIYTAAYLSAEMLAPRYPKAKVFVIGENGLYTALKDKKFEILNETYPDLENALIIPEGIVADFVIVGMDTKVTYNKLRTAMMLIINGAKYFATNNDASFPAPGTLWPGSGAIIAFLSAALAFPPKQIFGKPQPDGVFEILKSHQIDPNDAVVIGDRLTTDIAAGNNAGVMTIAVETGINCRADAIGKSSQLQPTFFVKDLSELESLFK